jgi:hypothetical protein
MKRVFVLFVVLVSVAAYAPKVNWAPYDNSFKGVYPGESWQKATTPEQLGWSSEKLAAARAYSERIGSAAVMIVDDSIVVDAWGDATRKYQCHSMRKSLLSALIGIHVEEGHIDLSKTLEELGIDDTEPSLTATEKQATIADLIKARSGIYHAALGEANSMKANRPERHSHAPGTFWYYNNWDFNAVLAENRHSLREQLVSPSNPKESSVLSDRFSNGCVFSASTAAWLDNAVQAGVERLILSPGRFVVQTICVLWHTRATIHHA